MKNFLVLTGFLIGLMAGVVVVGQQLIAAYEHTIEAGITSRLTSLKLAEVKALKKTEEATLADLFFVGDIMLSRGVEAKTKNSGNYKFPFLRVADFLKTGDIVFGNLESPLSNRGQNQGSEYSFRADPKMVEGLVYAGFNVLSLANNHVWDYGVTALTDTLKILTDNNIVAVGAGENEVIANEIAIKEVNGNKIGFLAYSGLDLKNFEATENSAGISNFDLTQIVQKVSNTKINRQADLIIVSIHWGEEYAEQPSGQQRAIARQIIDAGADLVIGHHPHVVQDYESYPLLSETSEGRVGQGAIFYSLGNFIFDQNFSEETMGGYLVHVKIMSGKILEWEVLGTKINGDYQVEIGESISGIRKVGL